MTGLRRLGLPHSKKDLALSINKQSFTTALKCESLLHHYATSKCPAINKQLHAQGITSGLLSSRKSFNLLPLLVSAYALCGYVSYARTLFNGLPRRNLLSYNTMIRMYTENDLPYNALGLFVDMLACGHARPNKYTYPYVIRACGNLLLLNLGVIVHGLTVTSGLVSDTFLGNSLLALYMNCGDTKGARRVFDTMHERTMASWNTMISGYYRNDKANEATMVFMKMVDGGEESDCATMLSVLPACGHLKALGLGKRVDSLVEEKGLGNKISVRNALMDMYAKCGRMDEAKNVFSKMGEKDVVTWTTMINGYILNGDAGKAFELCQMMQFEGIKPNAITLASLLSACSNLHSLKYGKCLHGWAMRQKYEFDVNVETALIDMYAKCNSFSRSLKVFRRTSGKRTVPWNAVLSGCIHNGLAREAISLFKEMLTEAVNPDVVTMNSLLPAYASQADLLQTMNIHSYATRLGFLSKVEVVTALINIYSKCGSLKYAHKLFNETPVENKDIILWSAIIAGYGMNGHGEIALSLFFQMVEYGVQPNEVTFTSVLHACSHAGLVDEGLSLFRLMLENPHLSPSADHYTCMVDLLGRAGRLKEAYRLVIGMPFQPNHAVWGAMLGACVIHENVELGEVAAMRLFELEPDNTGNYVLMSKIYAASGRWKEAESMRDMMNEIGLRKTPAHSSIDVRNM